METFSALLVLCAGSFYQSPANYPHKGQWHGALMFSFICDWINSWVHNREAGDLRRHRAHFDVIVMILPRPWEAAPAITIGKLAHSYMITCSICSYFFLNLSYVAYYRHSSWWINIFHQPYSKALPHCHQHYLINPSVSEASLNFAGKWADKKCRNETKTKQLIWFMGCMVILPVFQVLIALYALRNIEGWDIIVGGSLTRGNDKFISWLIFPPSKYLYNPSELI